MKEQKDNSRREASQEPKREKISWDEYRQVVQDALRETPSSCPCPGCCE